MISAAASLWQFASCLPYKLSSSCSAFWSLSWSIQGCYQSSASHDDHIQVLDLEPRDSSGLDEDAHLHSMVNSLCALISVTICVLSQAGEMGALQIFPGGEHREDCLFCVC